MKRRNVGARAKPSRVSKSGKTLPPGSIAIPCTGQIWSKTVQSLVSLSHHLPVNSTMSFLNELSTIAGKRNAAAAHFLDQQRHLKWLCFLDSDMVFPVDTINKLLQTPGDVIGGVYAQRHSPYFLVAGWVDNLSDDRRRPTDTERLHFQALTLDQLDGQSIPVDVLGTGLLLIHRRVLENMDPPWFEPNERIITGYGQGEDWNFTTRAKLAGFDVMCATGLFAEHLCGEQGLSLDFLRTWHAMQQRVGAIHVETSDGAKIDCQEIDVCKIVRGDHGNMRIQTRAVRTAR